jgi:hypothetical protein
VSSEGNVRTIFKTVLGHPQRLEVEEHALSPTLPLTGACTWHFFHYFSTIFLLFSPHLASGPATAVLGHSASLARVPLTGISLFDLLDHDPAPCDQPPGS